MFEFHIACPQWQNTNHIEKTDELQTKKGQMIFYPYAIDNQYINEM